MDLVESFLAVNGKGPRASTRALEQEHRREMERSERALRRHRASAASLRGRATGGAVVAGVAGAGGVIDAATAGALPFPLWAWFGAAAIGLVVTVRSRVRLQRLGPAPVSTATVAPPIPLPRGAVGGPEVSRLTAARVQVMSLAPSLDRLYPGSGAELRRADLEAAGPLTALADRLLVLDRMQRELPGTSAAESAAASALVVRDRLDRGCATYDSLLAAAARLLASPDLSRSTDDILGPAIDAMVAYAHGLETAADL